MKFFKKKEKSFNPLFMYVIIHMKKNQQIWYIFFNTQSYNLLVKKNVKIFVLCLKIYRHSKWSCTCAWRWKIGLNKICLSCKVPAINNFHDFFKSYWNGYHFVAYKLFWQELNFGSLRMEVKRQPIGRESVTTFLINDYKNKS